MEALLPNYLIMLVIIGIATAIFGYFVGSRTARKQQRYLQRELNQQSLDMLDVKSKHTKLAKFLGQSNRKDKLLKLTLKQLTEANRKVNTLQQRVNHIEKQHYIKVSRLRLLATQSIEKTRRARLIAARATSALNLLEEAHSSTAPAIATSPNKTTRVSNQDSARFTRLKSSNEGQRFNSANLQAIDGIDPFVEKKLNQVGIHRVEQIANLSDSELAILSKAFGRLKQGQTNKYYTAAWKGGAQRLLNQS